MGVLEVIGAYLILGVIVLGGLDLFTGRIRGQLKTVSYQTQAKLALSGYYVGIKTAMVIIMVALWIFWVVAIYGVLTSNKVERGSGQKRP